MPSVFIDALFWIAVASCAVAQLFIIRAVMRVVRPAATSAAPSALDGSAGEAAPPAMPVPNQPLEMLWAILPAGLLAVTFVAAWRLMHGTR